MAVSKRTQRARSQATKVPKARQSKPTIAPQTVPTAHLVGETCPTNPRLSRREAMVGLGAAAALIGGAWLVGGRAGFDQIGKGGVNQELLPKVGDKAPNFMALSSTNDPVWLYDFAGKPVWLNFWASWCAPCRSEMPHLQAAYERLAPQGIVLMSVSLDDAYDQAVEFAVRYGASFPVLNVPLRSLIQDTYPINNFPTHIFIAPDGHIRTIFAGPLDEPTAVTAAESLLHPATP